MERFINILKQNKYLQIILFVFLIYSLFYIILPFNISIGDFINDYKVIYGINNENVFLSLFYTNSFYGSFLNNLLTIINYKLFSYSDVFIIVFNYIINVSILAFTYLLFKPKKDDKKSIISYFIFLILATDFFGLFQTASMNDVKLMILITLISVYLLNKAFKYDDNKKYLFIALSFFVQLFAFNILYLFIYLYLVYKNKEDKWAYIIGPLAYMVLFAFNFQIFNNISNYDFNLRLIYTLASPIAPIIRIQNGEYMIWLFIVCAIITSIYLVSSAIAVTMKKNCDLSFILLLLTINLIISFLFYSVESYGYTRIHLVNRYIFSYTAFYLLINIYKNNSLKINFSFEKLAIDFSFFGVLITTLFGASFICINSDLYINGLYHLQYANTLDRGRLIKSDLNNVFEGTKDDILIKYQYFIDNGLIDQKDDINLEINKEYNSKNSVRYIRGSRVDSLNERWLQSNFAFEAYVADATMELTIFSPLQSNSISLYVNNKLVGEKRLAYGKNVLSFVLWEYKGANVIVNGFFEKEYRGPIDDEGYWSCELMDLSFSSEYGFFDKGIDANGWTGTRFGNFYENVTSSIIYTLYLPENHLPNEIDIYINRDYFTTYKINPGMNDIYIDLSDYIEKSVYIEFEVRRGIISDTDERVLGVILSKISEYQAINDIENKVYIDKPYILISFNNTGFIYNEVSIYIDEDYLGTYETKELEEMIIRSEKYFNKEVVIKEVYKVGVEKSVIKGISITNAYGFYHDNWTNVEFGFYIDNVNQNIILDIYEIESLNDNNFDIYINGIKMQSGTIYSGMNEVEIDLSEYINQSVYIDFRLEKYQDKSVDGRILGCILSGYREG